MLAFLSLILPSAESSWPRLVFLPGHVRRLCRLVTCDQVPQVPQNPNVVLIVLTGRYSSFEANAVHTHEKTLFDRHEVSRVSAPPSSMVSCEPCSTVSTDHHPQSRQLLFRSAMGMSS